MKCFQMKQLKQISEILLNRNKMNITSHSILYLNKIITFSMFTSLLITCDDMLLFTAPDSTFVVATCVVVVTVGLADVWEVVFTCPFGMGCLVLGSLVFSLLFVFDDGMFEVIGHAGSIFFTVKSSLYNTFWLNKSAHVWRNLYNAFLFCSSTFKIEWIKIK